MKVFEASYLKSAAEASQYPKDKMPEFAFSGRSNVGKSSLINLLAGRKDIARISATPGKTRLINFFMIDETWRMADLPGYGYAKVSKTERSEFSKLITEYIHVRENLHCMFVLIDCRLEPQESDIRFINFLGENNVPLAVVFTKVDKLSATQLKASTDRFRQALMAQWETLPEMFLTSAEKKQGREELLKYIGKIVKTSRR